MHRIQLATLSLFLLAGCNDCTSATPETHCDSGMCEQDGGSTVEDSGQNNGTDQGRATIQELRVEPEMATLVAADGATPSQDFEVVAVLDDGTTKPFHAVEFEIDIESLGQLDPASGVFTANGIVGGTATVTAVPADADLQPATATLNVTIERTVFADGTPPDADTHFDDVTMDPANAASIVYPLDGVVMPQNVYPADIQWLNGTDGDIFRVTITKPSATVVAYVLHSGAEFGNHWLVELDAWRSVAQTEPDSDATIVVDRWIAATQTAVTTDPVHMRFARAALSGTVYYWDIAAGRIVRIDDGTGEGVGFMPTPPPDANGTQCVGCHSVSNSGQYMVGRLGGGNNVGTVFDLTQDLSGNPPPTVWGVDTESGPKWWFSTWSPDDDRIAVTREEPNGPLAIMDPYTGADIVPKEGTLPTDHVTQPAWSPDGSLLAYVGNIDTWGGAMTSGEVWAIPVQGQDQFGEPEMLLGTDLPGASPTGSSNSYPTWAPDSQRLVFAHGTGARSERDQSALYAMNRDGTDVVRLDRANGGPDTTDNYQPNFSPFDQGGYFWLMFLSRRDYGNAEVGTRGSTRQQLWVTAIAKDAAPGEDPSAVAYWLPGQDTASMNIAGYWAPRACRDDGDDCSVGSECCSGTCAPNEDGDLVCSPPPPDRCREELETCGSTSDCCADDELICVENVCQHIVN
jgi:hypothetical protein